MAGTAGSSFTDELNRLANGGLSYPGLASYVADTEAANDWAGTSGLALLAALNKKASASRQPNEYKGLGAVCNELAGTTNLSPVDALRSITS